MWECFPQLSSNTIFEEELTGDVLCPSARCTHILSLRNYGFKEKDLIEVLWENASPYSCSKLNWLLCHDQYCSGWCNGTFHSWFKWHNDGNVENLWLIQKPKKMGYGNTHLNDSAHLDLYEIDRIPILPHQQYSCRRTRTNKPLGHGFLSRQFVEI